VEASTPIHYTLTRVPSQYWSTFSYSILSWLFAECKKGKLSVKRGFAEFETEILSKHITFPSAKIEKLGKIIACFQLRMIKRI
jgi:hypothetical protein